MIKRVKFQNIDLPSTLSVPILQCNAPHPTPPAVGPVACHTQSRCFPNPVPPFQTYRCFGDIFIASKPTHLPTWLAPSGCEWRRSCEQDGGDVTGKPFCVREPKERAAVGRRRCLDIQAFAVRWDSLLTSLIISSVALDESLGFFKPVFSSVKHRICLP